MSESEDTFARASTLSGDELEAFLAKLTERQRREVEERLHATIDPDPYATAAQDSVRPPSTTPTHQNRRSAVGGTPDSIGPYKILQRIGEGGMGQVFMAEQRKPVKRRVALKVINTDAPTDRILARFEAERQALAMMDHQHIAKVLDAGRAEDGRPYFAMELVKGIPITDFCDQKRLTPNDRLRLFVQTCRAIQHAHEKGIIHRDIKPSNVLVAQYDDRPVAKVIDFGLAKAINDQIQLTEKTLFTQYGQVVGTLEYMSPEQAELNPLGIDVRTDVYSLGIMLYELLTGSTPIGRERLRSNTFAQVLAMIREEESPRPSKRLSDSGDALSGISDQRQTNPRQLTEILKGDLDWIAMKAIEKERTLRYDGAGALADDIERFIRDEPIHARPPTIWYRAKKIVRKHGRAARVAAAAWIAGALAMFAIVLVITANWSSDRTVPTGDANQLTGPIDPGIDSSSVPHNPPRPAKANTENPNGDVQNAKQESSPPLDVDDDIQGELKRLINPDSSDALPVMPISQLSYEGHTGTIRTLSLSQDRNTLISAGEDKTVHVWRRTHSPTEGTGEWLNERTIRWNVSGGSRGIIHASALTNEMIAFAGHGAFGGIGEIRLADAASGETISTLVDGHRQVNFSLDWAPGQEQQLASADLEGHVRLWEIDPDSKLWVSKTLVERDAITYDEKTAAALVPFRGFVPLTFSGKNHVVVPQFNGTNNDTAAWGLHRIDIRDGTTQTISDVVHATMIRDLESTPDGRVLCSAGCEGTVAVWTFDEGRPGKAKVFRMNEPALFIDLAPDGKQLVVGTEDYDVQANKRTNARLKLYNLEPAIPELISERSLASIPFAGVWDGGRDEVIVSQGSEIEIFSLDQSGKFKDEPPKRLRNLIKPVVKVAFARNEGTYKLAFGTASDAEGNEHLNGVFDLSESKLLRGESIDPADYIPSQRTSVRWLVGPTEDNRSFQLYEADSRRGVLPLDMRIHGTPTTYCTLPQPQSDVEAGGEYPASGAVVIGTDGRNNIYVYAADQSDPPRLLRQFHGHQKSVLSIGTSSDGNYLASGGDDSLIMIWNLQGLFTTSESVNRWGVEFKVEDNHLVAAEVREDGPLYFRGVRAGDRLVAIQWTNNEDGLSAESHVEKMLVHLTSLPFDTFVQFSFTRLGRSRPGFQSFAAWRPLAKLFVDEAGKWAYWTEAGYYDASPTGDMRFGWMINRSLDESPEFFPAIQFRSSLKSPELMEQLLSAGSVPAAKRRLMNRLAPNR